MPNDISNIVLSQLSTHISTHMGLNFHTERWPDLQKGICSAAPEFGFKDAESCAQWLLSSSLTKNQIEILASNLTIGETYFFREKPIFNAFREHILEKLVHSRRDNNKLLRIWSAGCATGEEPYSIAIILSEIIPNIKDWNVTVLAIDINPHSLKKALKGIYKEWSFRSNPPEIKEKYFKRLKEGDFEILPHIRKMVKFTYLNLMEDVYPSLLNDTNAMDVIFCRNVLMYFNSESQKKVIQKLYCSLVDDGWVIVSPSETSSDLFSQFHTVNFQGAFLYRKDLHKKPRLRVHPKQDVEITIPLFTPRAPVDLSIEVKPHTSLAVKTDKTQLPYANQEKLKPNLPTIPEPLPTSYEEALALYEQGSYAEAAEKLLEMVKDNPKAIALLARVYANQGKLGDALNWCDKAVNSDKMNPGFHYLRAIILQEQGQIEEAIASLFRALYLEPDFVLAHFSLGNLTRQQGKFKESDRHFRNSLLLLQGQDKDNSLPESDGITIGRLSEIISYMTEKEIKI